MVNVIYSRF